MLAPTIHGALLVLLAACASRGHAPAPDAGTPVPARLAAVERCREAYGELATNPTAGAATVVRACAGLYLRATCRDAIAAARGGDDLRHAMLGPCRVAYCPDLPPPIPAACRGAPENTDEAARELDVAILALDLGVDRAATARVSLFHSTASGGRPTPVDAPMVAIGLAVDGTQLVVTHRGRSWRLPAGASEADFAPVVADLPMASSDLQVVIDTDQGIPHAPVVALMKALRAAGHLNLAIATKAGR